MLWRPQIWAASSSISRAKQARRRTKIASPTKARRLFTSTPKLMPILQIKLLALVTGRSPMFPHKTQNTISHWLQKAVSQNITQLRAESKHIHQELTCRSCSPQAKGPWTRKSRKLKAANAHKTSSKISRQASLLGTGIQQHQTRMLGNPASEEKGKKQLSPKQWRRDR